MRTTLRTYSEGSYEKIESIIVLFLTDGKNPGLDSLCNFSNTTCKVSSRTEIQPRSGDSKPVFFSTLYWTYFNNGRYIFMM